TKASISVSKNTTSVKASAVPTVLFQRKARWRRLYAKGTLPRTTSRTGTAVAHASGAGKDHEPTNNVSAMASSQPITRAKTSATLTVRADLAGQALPTSAVIAPRAGPHQKAWIGTTNSSRNRTSRSRKKQWATP